MKTVEPLTPHLLENASMPWTPVLAAMLLAAALFAVTLAGEYVYDDRAIALNDPRVHVPGEWVGYFRQAYFPHAADPLWRPLTSLSFVLHWRLHGELAWPLHLVNVLLHAAVSGLVAVLAWRLTRSAAVMWLAGLIFAAHPVHVEAVAYLVGRAETLCALGVVGGLVLFSIRPLTHGRAWGILGCFALAVASKEHGLLLAPMLGVWYGVERSVQWAVGGRQPAESPPADRPMPTEQERMPLIVLFFLMSIGILLYISVREQIAPLHWEIFFLHWTVNPVARAEGIDRVLVPFTILGRYGQLLLWPHTPSPDYGAQVISYRIDWRDPYLYLGFSVAIAYLAGLIVAWRWRNRAVLVLLLCAGLAYMLISNSFYIIGIGMGERLIYLTSAFVIILLAMGLARLPRRVLVPVAAVLLGLATVRTATYAWQWNDELRLYSHARQRHPESIQLHFLEAYMWYERGDLETAERILERGRAIGPETQNIWALSALIAELRDEPELAESYGLRAHELELDPPHMRQRRPR